jgi:hypothetical protein
VQEAPVIGEKGLVVTLKEVRMKLGLKVRRHCMRAVISFNWPLIKLTDVRWKHITVRHPELEGKIELVLSGT